MIPANRPGTLDYLMTVEDVAKVLTISKRTVWRWLKAGRLPVPLRLSRITVRWRARDIQELLAAQNGNSAARKTMNDE